MCMTAIAIGVGLTAAATVGSYVENKNAAEDTKKAREAQTRMNEKKQRREMLQQLREGQIRRAQIVSSAAAQGASESSGAAGGTGAVMSQTAGNMAFIQQTADITAGISNYMQAAADHQTNAQGWQALGSLGSNAMSYGMS